MSAYATTADLAAELGQPHPDDETTLAQWNRWLTKAENQIRARIPDLDARALDPHFEALVLDAEVAAAARKSLNPKGLASRTVSIDDGSVTERRREDLSDQDVFISDADWALLLGEKVEAFSTRVRYEPGWRT